MGQSRRLPSEAGSPVTKALDGVELVIFDFDGVIADSEVLSLGTLRDALADCGLPMPLEQVRALFLGTSLASILEYTARHGAEGASDGFTDRWQNALYGRLRNELKPMTSILPFLDGLKERGIRHCVASSSSFERIRLSLSVMGLEDRFPDLFSAQQVQSGKPAPDLFLFAAEHMNTDAAACLVIEDSPHGVQAAQAAGMRAFGFVDGAHLNGLQNAHADVLLNAGAERVLNSFADLLHTSSNGGSKGQHWNQVDDT